LAKGTASGGEKKRKVEHLSGATDKTRKIKPAAVGTEDAAPPTGDPSPPKEVQDLPPKKLQAYFAHLKIRGFQAHSFL
jgi:hypothetical protein